MAQSHAQQTTQVVANLQAEVNRLKHELVTMKVDEQIPAASQTCTIAEYLLERLVQLQVTVRNISHPRPLCLYSRLSRTSLVCLETSILVRASINPLRSCPHNPQVSWITSKTIPSLNGPETGMLLIPFGDDLTLSVSSNELNASYAADGYARVKEGSLGVLVTTFGVGELSATNGIAGAFSERVPVLHIAGVPSTAQQKSKPMLHHTLGDGRFDAYLKASQQFVISYASLQDTSTAAAEIDRVITECVVTAHPVYLMLPTDLVHEQISTKRLKTPLNIEPPANDAEVESFVLDEIVKLIEEADRDVVILVDACAIRHNVKKEVFELAERTHFPVYSAPMGKTAIPEDYERYGGVSTRFASISSLLTAA